jgi:uncharacterized protein (DUF3820 family)
MSKCKHEKQKEEMVTFNNGTEHLKVTCEKCGKFIKYKAQNKLLTDDFIMPFGKHKGESLIDIARGDVFWLEWFSDQDSKLSPKIRRYLDEFVYANKDAKC